MGKNPPFFDLFPVLLLGTGPSLGVARAEVLLHLQHLSHPLKTLILINLLFIFLS